MKIREYLYILPSTRQQPKLMQQENIYSHITFDEYSATPKYLQLSHAIVKAVQDGKIGKGYVLPSINDLSFELDLGRHTVEKAYRQLKNVGLVESFPGKGYFISKNQAHQTTRVFLLFNKLSAHKKIIYDTFVIALGERATIDFYVYNNDFALFKKLLQQKADSYDYSVIIPHFLEGGEQVADVINGYRKGRLILLDKQPKGVEPPYGAVYEDFEHDIYDALTTALPHLRKYRTLKIIFPSYTYFPEEIIKGFRSFCAAFSFGCKVVENLEQEPIHAGEVYINLMEDDLVVLLEKIRHTALQVGKDVGIISYNETPWKKFILDGITTMSTNFQKMGELTAAMILENQLSQVAVPFTLTVRASI